MRHFLGSVGVRGSVRGPFFTRHPGFPTGNEDSAFLGLHETTCFACGLCQTKTVNKLRVASRESR